MKRILLTIVAGLFTVCPAVAKSGSEVMKYRIVPVGSSGWMSAKVQDVEQTRLQIDRIAEDGFNIISVGTYNFMPMYFIDYGGSPYPEAVQFDAAKVKSNLETFRSHIRYAHKKGVKVVSRSYSHYAPLNFWRAHQKELNPEGVFDDLLRRAHQNDMFQKALANKSPWCVPQQQWTNDTFREFFLWSTCEMLDLIPELDGFLNAYAEAAWTYDVDKVRTGGWKSWKECVDYPKTDSCFVDYSNRLSDMLRDKKGDDYFFGLRDWYISPEILAKLSMPKDKLVIAVKYAGYDQPLINYPPWAKDLLDEGFSVVLDMHVYDAEYPNPVYWYDYNTVNKIFENTFEGGFTGIVYQDYSLRGEDKADNPIRVLTQKTVSAAMQRNPFTEKDAVAFLRPYYGKGAEEVLRSLAAVGRAQETYIKLMPAWFWRGDGLSVGGVQPQGLWMMADNPEADGRMGFVRQNVVSMKKYIDTFLEGEAALASAGKQWKADGMLTPPDVIEVMNRCADEALEAVLAARGAAPKNAPYMQDMVASALIHQQLVLRNAAFIRAAMAFYKSGYVYNGKYEPNRERVRDTGFDLSDEVVAELRNYIAADLLMRRTMLDYAPRRRTLRHNNTYENEKKITYVLKKKLEIPELDERAFKQISAMIERKQ